MSEPDDAPPPRTDDFVAWMSSELPDVASAGRRIQRRHHRRAAISPSRWPGVRRLRRVDGRVWVRWIAAGAVLALALWGTVEILHPFGLGIDVPSPAAVAPPIALTDDQLFPPNTTWFGHAYERVGTATAEGCHSGAGVPEGIATLLREIGGCQRIRLAEYVERADRVRIGIGVIEMSDAGRAASAFIGGPQELAPIGLLTDPGVTTMFASAMQCATYAVFAGTAPTPGAHTDETTMVDAASHVINTVSLAACPDPSAVSAPSPSTSG